MYPSASPGSPRLGSKRVWREAKRFQEPALERSRERLVTGDLGDVAQQQVPGVAVGVARPRIEIERPRREVTPHFRRRPVCRHRPIDEVQRVIVAIAGHVVPRSRTVMSRARVRPGSYFATGSPLLGLEIYTPYNLTIFAICAFASFQPLEAYEWASHDWGKRELAKPLSWALAPRRRSSRRSRGRSSSSASAPRCADSPPAH